VRGMRDVITVAGERDVITVSGERDVITVAGERDVITVSGERCAAVAAGTCAIARRERPRDERAGTPARGAVCPAHHRAARPQGWPPQPPSCTPRSCAASVAARRMRKPCPAAHRRSGDRRAGAVEAVEARGPAGSSTSSLVHHTHTHSTQHTVHSTQHTQHTTHNTHNTHSTGCQSAPKCIRRECGDKGQPRQAQRHKTQ
jgi:hypothetical protein